MTSIRMSAVSCLAAVLLSGAAARAGGPGQPARPAPPGSKVAAAAGAPAAAGVERHSPPEGYPSLGPAGAPNTLVFFTDYQCPVCPRAAREMENLVASFKGELRVELHHNPLVMHRNAYDAAAAAKAAQRQGKFWEYHAALLETRTFDRSALVELAGRLGLNRASFERDFDDPKLRERVTAEAKEALDANALGTPGFLINGHVEVGWASLPWLEQVVRTHSR
ncbi:MAG TPA: thioredoxin domain-containing protein [Candidatus Polarisedimenticolia bacterium]|nr:thioredoxin domain-containing protein [Candidatus Polarisedimenticolia bacterium]